MQKAVVFIFLIFLGVSLSAQTTSSDEIIKKGISLFDENKYEDALKMYKMVHENDSNYTYMLTEMALCYLQMEKYDSAILIANKGLVEPNKFRQHLLKTKGTSYDYSGQSDKAIETYNEAIKSYPYSYQLHYNLGITYLNKKEFAKAQDCFMEALRCNVFHASSHLQLGLLMARQGLITKAMLSLETYLSLEPSSNRSNTILVFAENLVSGVEDTSMGKPITPFTENQIFQEVDDLIKSKVALSPRYKSAIDFNANIVKQTQLLMESLPFNAESDDFWAKLYLPFFSAIKTGDYLEPFLFTILRSSGKDEVVKYNKRNEKELKEFYDTGNVLSVFSSKRKVNIDGKEYLLECKRYDNGNIYSLGNIDAVGKEQGMFMFFFSNGELMSKGVMINGVKDGEWIYYNNDGSLKTIEHFKDGMLNGEFKMFHETAKEKVIVNYVNDKANGEVTWFDIFGLKQQTAWFENSERNGMCKFFYPSGKIKEELVYKKGKVDGALISYHPNGKISSKYIYKDGVLHGDFEEYYSTGILSYKGSYNEGKENGDWIYYYSNGKLKKSISYNEGKAFGLIKEYYYNGVLQSETNLNKSGNIHGIINYYDHNGLKMAEEEYNNGTIVRITSFDKFGNKNSNSENSRGTFSFTTYYPNGKKKTIGEFKNGNRAGEWTRYYKNGNPSRYFTYNNGELEGELKYYHLNGAVSEVYNYKNGVLEGNYFRYSSSGILTGTGMYKDGEQDNIWTYYLQNGVLEYSSYLINGELNGWTTNYSVDGKVKFRNKIKNGLIISQLEYNSKGEVINEINFLETSKYTTKGAKDIIMSESVIIGGKYNGTFTWYHPDGKILSRSNIENANKEGEYVRYYKNGNINTIGNYFNDMKVGKWTKYYESGKIQYIENYFNNMQDSINTYYYENGNISVIESYFNDEYDGDVLHYDPNGDLMVKLIYSDGDLVGYQYKKGDNLIDTILITNGNQPVIAYYADGTKSFEQQYKNYMLDGVQKKYYRNGTVRQIKEFKDGVVHGNFEEYYSNGKIKLKYTCDKGLYQGEYIEYWESGQIKEITTYLNDQEHGETKYFDKDGKLIKVEDFWSGNFIGYK